MPMIQHSHIKYLPKRNERFLPTEMLRVVLLKIAQKEKSHQQNIV